MVNGLTLHVQGIEWDKAILFGSEHGNRTTGGGASMGIGDGGHLQSIASAGVDIPDKVYPYSVDGAGMPHQLARQVGN